MGVYNATVITNAGQNLIASAIAGGQAINFTAVKTSTHVYPAGTALLNLTSLSDVKQTVAPTSVDVYNNNVVQISARVPNTGIATAYLINTIGLFGSADGAETLIAVLTAQTPDEVPVFDAEAPAAFIFNIQMTIQNADEVVFEVNDTGTATVADLNRVAQPFTGATASAAGSVGRVPAPAAGANKKFLCGDGTWTAPADMVEDFTSSDVADGSATAWTGVNPLTSGETNKSIFAKLSQMFKNIRYLYKMLGTTDISSIGNGTVTGVLTSLNDSFTKLTTERVVQCSITDAGLIVSNQGIAYFHVPLRFRFALLLCRFVTYNNVGYWFLASAYINYSDTAVAKILDKSGAIQNISFVHASDGTPTFVVTIPGHENTRLISCDLTILAQSIV